MFVLLQTMTEGTLRHTFNKAERLCRRNDFEQIFSQGAAFNRFPFRVYWLKVHQQFLLKLQLVYLSEKSEVPFHATVLKG